MVFEKEEYSKVNEDARYRVYVSPLVERYSSEEMLFNFSPLRKFRTWRKLWLVLAEVQKELGLPISEEQLEEIRLHLEDIPFKEAEELEAKTRHDVTAHLKVLANQCPKAAPILHLGATSAYVGDNTELIQMRDALDLTKRRLVGVIKVLALFAEEYKELPVLGFTHLQPAQPTTLGKRSCLWTQDLIMDLHSIECCLALMKFRGAKGTTGTQASFLSLFEGDEEKVKELDRRVTQKMGFQSSFSVTGQTYPRKLDSIVLGCLSGIAQSASKFGCDVRLMMHLKEMEEPIEEAQVGSSAMAFKRNPVKCERICSLARYVITLALNPCITAAEQWLERTLDDSANRRMAIPEAFLAVDGILLLYRNVVEGMQVHPNVIHRHLEEELPFLATETLLMECVKKGGNRQELHERIKKHSWEVAREIMEKGKENSLLERLRKDPAFHRVKKNLEQLVEPSRFVGRSRGQVADFLSKEVYPLLERYKAETAPKGEPKV